MEDSYESLHEDSVRAWLRAKNTGTKVVASPQFPVSRSDDAIRYIWMTTAARRKAAWEALALASTSGCTRSNIILC
jgi:hypothetical protein